MVVTMKVSKKEVLSKFLEADHQLDVLALEFFAKNPEKIGAFLENIKTNNSLKRHATITLDHVDSVLGGLKEDGEPKAEEPKKLTTEIIKEYPARRKKEKIGVEQYISIYNNLYEKISKLLLEKMSGLKVTSINKIQRQTEFSLIVMIREKDPVDRTLLVEDPTGNVIVSAEDEENDIILAEHESIRENDILGLRCERTQGSIKIKQIIWPDVPLNREINRSVDDVKCLFLSNLHIGSTELNDLNYKKLVSWIEKTKFEKFYIIVLGGLSTNKKDTIEFFSSLPKNSFKIFLRSDEDAKISSSDINKGNGIVFEGPILISIEGVRVFLIRVEWLKRYKSTWGDSTTAALIVNLLKRRHLVKDEDAVDMIIFDQVPDVFATDGCGLPETLNYKGTNIISTGGFSQTPIAWLLELRTREINKLDFS